MSKFNLKVEQSRFSALRIEDDEEEGGFTVVKGKKGGNANGGSKQQQTNGAPAKENGPKKPKKKPSEEDVKRDLDVWKQKDEQFTDELFKEQLKKAMLESKQEFDQKKTTETTKSKPKQIKMSLDEFQKNFDSIARNTSAAKNEKSLEDQEKEIEESVKKIMVHEKSAPGSKSETIEKHLYLQLKAELEKKDEQMASLTAVIISLKDELAEVKRRNSKLANILAQGEIREKAELLSQLDELTAIKEELTERVTGLYQSLEQEKSKVHHLENEHDAKKAKTAKK